MIGIITLDENMENPDFNENRFLDLKEFLNGSLILKPYKEEVGHFFGEQYLIAIELWQKGQIDEALPIFDDIYEICPKFFLHKFIRLADRVHNEKSEILLAELDRIDHTIFPEILDKFFYHMAKAILLFKQFDLEDCINECKKANLLIRDFSPLYILLGDSLMLIHQYEEAIKNYKISLKAKYRINETKANLAYAYLRVNKNRRARKYFRAIVDIFPDNYKIQYNMALCYLRAKKYDLAHEYLKRVERINENFSGLYLTRGGIYLKQNKRELAILSLEKASQLGNIDAEIILKNITLQKGI